MCVVSLVVLKCMYHSTIFNYMEATEQVPQMVGITAIKVSLFCLLFVPLQLLQVLSTNLKCLSPVQVITSNIPVDKHRGIYGSRLKWKCSREMTGSIRDTYF